jgi:hypothetical protein
MNPTPEPSQQSTSGDNMAPSGWVLENSSSKTVVGSGLLVSLVVLWGFFWVKLFGEVWDLCQNSVTL